MKVLRFRYLLLLIISISLVGGCNATNKNSEQSSEGTALIRTTNPPPLAAENTKDEAKSVKEIKKMVMANSKIYDAAIIKGDEGVLVAYKVRHMHRLRMKQIEKELKKELEKKYPDEKFSVSSDYKIFLEAVRLQEKSEKENLPSEKIEKRLSEIIKLSEEKT